MRLALSCVGCQKMTEMPGDLDVALHDYGTLQLRISSVEQGVPIVGDATRNGHSIQTCLPDSNADHNLTEMFV